MHQRRLLQGHTGTVTHVWRRSRCTRIADDRAPSTDKQRHRGWLNVGFSDIAIFVHIRMTDAKEWEGAPQGGSYLHPAGSSVLVGLRRSERV
jgi:hypothetical protein